MPKEGRGHLSPQGAWVQREGACRRTGLFALGQMWHPDQGQNVSEEVLVPREWQGPASFATVGVLGTLLSAEGLSVECPLRCIFFPLLSLFCTARVKTSRHQGCCRGIASG